MNELLKKAKLWFESVGVRTKVNPTQPGCLYVNIDDVTAFSSIHECMDELKRMFHTNKFISTAGDDFWFCVESF